MGAWLEMQMQVDSQSGPESAASASHRGGHPLPPIAQSFLELLRAVDCRSAAAAAGLGDDFQQQQQAVCIDGGAEAATGEGRFALSPDLAKDLLEAILLESEAAPKRRRFLKGLTDAGPASSESRTDLPRQGVCAVATLPPGKRAALFREQQRLTLMGFASVSRVEEDLEELLRLTEECASLRKRVSRSCLVQRALKPASDPPSGEGLPSSEALLPLLLEETLPSCKAECSLSAAGLRAETAAAGASSRAAADPSACWDECVEEAFRLNSKGGAEDLVAEAQDVLALFALQQKSIPACVAQFRRSLRLMYVHQQHQEELLAAAAAARTRAAASLHENAFQYALLWGCMLLLLRQPAPSVKALLAQLQQQTAAEDGLEEGEASDTASGEASAESPELPQTPLSMGVALFRLAAAASCEELADAAETASASPLAAQAAVAVASAAASAADALHDRLVQFLKRELELRAGRLAKVAAAEQRRIQAEAASEESASRLSSLRTKQQQLRRIVHEFAALCQTEPAAAATGGGELAAGAVGKGSSLDASPQSCFSKSKGTSQGGAPASSRGAAA